VAVTYWKVQDARAALLAKVNHALGTK